MEQHNQVKASEFLETENFKSFLNCAKEFCSFIENLNPGTVSFLEKTQGILLRLYLSALNLNDIDLQYETGPEPVLDKDEHNKILSNIASASDESYYSHIFDPSQLDDDEPCIGDLIDDLGDIYRDIKEALMLFDTHEAPNVESALWHFNFGFHHHWGQHCINAAYAIHFFKQAKQ